MKFSQMIQSKYLKKDDLDEDVIVTVRKFTEQNVAADGQPEDKKWVLYFDEYEKGLVLNSTNIQLLQNATGASGPEEAVGKEIILYVDPNISFGGKIVGGLRIRAHHKVAAPIRPARAAKAAPAWVDDDIPLD